ncbi:hypothetical protein NE237_002234 [Protea cynaroides]|uniref:Uncharacterized protein n=1 Tax=Protea cynaroides TaxID=273540 RepID=A0A9Q0QYW0_9MAGN|nr:hypothetical protein NE237_002234 [Protea cynaroides]
MVARSMDGSGWPSVKNGEVLSSGGSLMAANGLDQCLNQMQRLGLGVMISERIVDLINGASTVSHVRMKDVGEGIPWLSPTEYAEQSSLPNTVDGDVFPRSGRPDAAAVEFEGSTDPSGEEVIHCDALQVTTTSGSELGGDQVMFANLGTISWRCRILVLKQGVRGLPSSADEVCDDVTGDGITDARDG